MRNYYNDPERLKRERQFTCVVCSERWPESQMHYQDGIASDRRCPNDFEPNGGTIARNKDRAAAASLAASITGRYAGGPKWTGWFDERSSMIVDLDPEPRVLHRGGASATLTISGQNLAATDTIAYSHAGITDASAPVLTPVTYDGNGNAESPYYDTLVLTVQASGATPIGLYNLTYNSSNTFYGVFDVRA